MRTTLHVSVVSHHQVGLTVPIKMASVGPNVTVTIRPPMKSPWTKNPESNHIAEIVVQLHNVRLHDVIVT
jgi:hypothetical protein